MDITIEMIKKLREETGVGVMDSREALKQANGDYDKAVVYLREKGLAKAAKQAERAAHEGVIGSYLHHNSRVAVLVDLSSETDFVARTPDFGALAQNLAMHVAMANPRYLKPEDIPPDVLEAERASYRIEAEGTGKPAHVVEKIVAGKLEKFYDDVCLLRQAYIKDDKLRVNDLVAQAVAKLGENIVVRRFVRYEIGGE